MIKLLLYTALVSVCISSTAQVSIIIPGTPVVETFTGFAGSGFAPSPSSGQLDADNWQITGFSDGNLAFGGTRTTGDYARGVTGGNVTVGGIYGYSGGLGNQALYIQPAASDFVPGTITTRYLNITGTTITSVDFSYVIYNYNNEARSTSLKLSYSFDNISFTNVPSADFNSFGAADFLLYTFNRSVTIPGLSFLNGGTMYLKWISDDVIGFTGNRDEIGLDNITLNAHTDPIPIPVINFNSELPFYDEGVGTISVDVQIATPHDCNAFIHINHDVTSAINGVDFILPEETEVSFSAGGGIIQTISIPILNDINPEYQDAIYLEIDSVSPGCSIGEPHFKLMFIDDNDDPVIADCSNLIISQYGEGSGVANNKVLEIYNPTPSAVDLSNYWVQIYLNGNLGPSYYFNCNGMLAAGDAYVITPEDANPALLAQADTVGGGAAFDGNDAVVLYQGPDMIDKIGIIGVDPGPGGWMVAAGSTTNNSLSRKSNIKMGQLDWTIGATEWNVLGTNNFSGLNTHVFDGCGCAVPTGIFVNMITNSSAKINWIAVAGATKYQIQYRPIGGGAWLKKNATSTSKNLTGLLANTVYQYKVKTICGGSSSAFSPIANFTTLPLRSEINEEISSKTEIYPNPSNGNFQIVVAKDMYTDVEVEVYNILGTEIYREVFDNINGKLEMDLTDLIPGQYIIRIKTDSFIETKKIFIN